MYVCVCDCFVVVGVLYGPCCMCVCDYVCTCASVCLYGHGYVGMGMWVRVCAQIDIQFRNFARGFVLVSAVVIFPKMS